MTLFIQFLILPLVIAISGYAAVHTAPSNEQRAPLSHQTDSLSTGSTNDSSASWPSTDSASDFPTGDSTKTFPRLVMPMTGGDPVTAIPLGGNLYQPLAGGGIITGMPLD